MKLLIPLGLLGLLAIIALIIIYLIRPNYLQKVISSTYVWNLSLKYRRKRLPINKILNLLILICQIVIIIACAFILAKPVIKSVEGQRLQNEKIAIIDASGNMLAETNGITRFERAVEKVDELAHEVMSNDGYMTVILATSQPEIVVQRRGSDSKNELYESIKKISGKENCTFGTADIESAMELADSVLVENSGAEVLLYTATSYQNAGNVTVVDVSDSDNEWNAAIINCTEIYNENRYGFLIDVASYGRPQRLTVKLEIFGVNYEGVYREAVREVDCVDGEIKTVEFNPNEDEFAANAVYTYDYVKVTIDAEDSLKTDNEFYLYGGKKETLKVMYYSSLANPYCSGILMAMRDIFGSKWNFELTEVRASRYNPQAPATMGYDFYIYEHTMPDELPSDGAVFLINPDKAPSNSGLVLGSELRANNAPLTAGEAHAVTSGIDASKITVSQYRQISSYPDYTPLMLCGVSPVLLVKNAGYSRVAVLSFSLNYSNLPLRFVEQATLFYNLFNYFTPATLERFSYDVGETVTFNSRGKSVLVEYENASGDSEQEPLYSQSFEEFPAKIALTTPGTYLLTHTLLSNAEEEVRFFVKMSAAESNIFKQNEELINPTIHAEEILGYDDLIIYLAAVLVALLFVEWLLQAREYF